MKRKPKPTKLPGTTAWAWLSPTLGLAYWAEPTHDRLFARGRMSEDSKAIRVRIVPVSELKKAVKRCQR